MADLALTTRRSVFAGVALAPALAAVPAIAATGDDDELIALCRRVLDASKAYVEAVDFSGDHPALPALNDIMNEGAFDIADMPARTRLGLLCKARVLKDRMPKATDGANLWSYANETDALTWSLCEDLLLMSPAA